MKTSSLFREAIWRILVTGRLFMIGVPPARGRRPKPPGTFRRLCRARRDSKIAWSRTGELTHCYLTA